MSELRDLYQQVIVDHSKKPRNFGKISPESHHAEGYNPLCGDQVVIHVNLEGDAVSNLSFEGSGCAISTASASMMTDYLKGKSKSEVKTLFEAFHKMITSPPGTEFDEEQLGKLAVFSGVCEFPSRVKCATLCWHTLQNAIEGKAQLVTTE